MFAIKLYDNWQIIALQEVEYYAGKRWKKIRQLSVKQVKEINKLLLTCKIIEEGKDTIGSYTAYQEAK